MAFNGENLTSHIICKMCVKQQYFIDPAVAKQVEFTLVGEFNVAMTHIKPEDYCDGCYRLLMLTQRMMIKIRQRNERIQRAKADAEKATPLFFEPGKETTARKRSASAEKDERLEQPKAKRVRVAGIGKDDRRKSRAV